MTRLFLLSCLAMLSGAAAAESPQQILAAYQQQAGSASASRGEKFFFAKVPQANGETAGCTSCHTDNPKSVGKTRAHKSIEPLAPIANRERFTDPAKVEKWFRRNCNDVLGRECSAAEKADVMAWLIGLKP